MNIHLTPSVEQHFYLSQKMVVSLFTLQLPVAEFAEWVKEEVEKNPLLEREYTQEPVYSEVSIVHHPSLFEHLMNQARQIFSSQELPLAEILIGNLDDKGFLCSPLDAFTRYAPLEILDHFLGMIQTLDPPGIGARCLQESLLIQLTFKGKAHSLGYQLVKDHFDHLLHHRFSQIQKATGLSIKKIQEIIVKEITPLDIHPGRRFLTECAPPIIPDISLKKEEDAWRIEINEEPLPQFKISSQSNHLYDQLTPEEKPYLEQHLLSAEWLKQLIEQRQETLHKIAQYILKIQEPFFDGCCAAPIPMTVHDIAEALGRHRSTISRALLHKHLAYPGGMIPMQELLSHAQSPSHLRAKEKIAELIENENKCNPLSDELLSQKLKNIGISCARRTVAKYRHALNIPSVPFRIQNH